MNIPNWIETHITLHNHDNKREELANALTHALGAVLSAGACIYILSNRNQLTKPGLLAGFIVYALSMLLLYTASSLYHFLPKNNWKRVCRILDHSNIYILIAGTYTPMLAYIHSPMTDLLLLLVWGITALGIIFTIRFWGKYGILHVLLYLAMGWMVVFFWGDIVPNIPSGLINWIIAGGITYSAGTIFYAIKKIPYYHAIWHIFVLGGSACFFAGFAIHFFS